MSGSSFFGLQIQGIPARLSQALCYSLVRVSGKGSDSPHHQAQGKFSKQEVGLGNQIAHQQFSSNKPSLTDLPRPQSLVNGLKMGDGLHVPELSGSLYWSAIATIVLQSKQLQNQCNTTSNIYFLLPRLWVSWNGSPPHVSHPPPGTKVSSWEQWL